MEGNANRVALITGANKGIGHETARQLGKKGMTVLLGARDEGRGEEAARGLVGEGIDAQSVCMDVTDQASVDAAATYVDETFGRLDVLVNNAGILNGPSEVSEAGADVMRESYEVNVFGVVAVTHAMLSLLRRSPAARVVNVTSELGSLTLMSDPESPLAEFNTLAYNSSKAALNAITVLYANELRGTPILVNAASPGHVATDFNHHSGELTVEQGARVPARAATLPTDDGPTGRFFSQDGEAPW